MPSSICSAISTSISNLSVETFIERCNSNFVNAGVPDFQIKIDKVTEIPDDEFEELNVFLNGTGKFRLNSDQFFDLRYREYYISQKKDEDIAIRLAREEAIRYKSMRIHHIMELFFKFGLNENNEIDPQIGGYLINEMFYEDPNTVNLWLSMYPMSKRSKNITDYMSKNVKYDCSIENVYIIFTTENGHISKVRFSMNEKEYPMWMCR